MGEIQVSLISTGAGSTCLGIRGIRKIYSQFYHPIQGSLRVFVDPVAHSLVETHKCGWGKGEFHGWSTGIHKKEKNSQLLHATRGVFSCMVKYEYWLSLLSIDRIISSLDNLNHRRISADL